MAYGQSGTRPDQFPIESAPTNDNFEVYSQKDGISKRASLDALASFFDPKVTFIVSAPPATGNTQNLGEFVSTPGGEYYYIDHAGMAIQLGGGAIIYGVYKNDADAASSGVPLDGRYEVAQGNTLGKPAGDIRRRKY